ncbi:SAV_2336 N-terminal domain-related protein [Actinoplanes sp. NPDC048796]|uniref:SAV_2336 N-terminal domain-related protein n=1 Tax=Actinoplanes sp. NPDC048796 TaxID=3155640 RepID=UPI003407B658
MTTERAIRALLRLDPGAEPVEIAEALWLARQLPGAERPHGSETTPRPNESVQPGGGNDDRASTGAPGRPDPGRALSPGDQTGSSPTSAEPGESIIVRRPDRRPGGAPVSLIRALRPLNRRVAGNTGVQLDEEATARYRADFGFWLPVLRPADRRWINLLIITDTSPSMDVWRTESEELRVEIGRLRIFGHLQHEYLTITPDGPELSPSAAGAPERPRRVARRDSARRVILLITDGVAPFWHSPAAADFLRSLAGQDLTAIVQPLPQRLWPRTALSAEVGRLTAFSPPPHNGALAFASADDDTVPIPVFEMQPGWLAAWATLIAGGSVPDAAVVPVGEKWGRPVAEPSAGEADEEADDVLRAFRAVASPSALRLAARLSVAAPLTLPIIRYVQQATLPRAGSAEIAEVFLGGLLRRVAPGSGTGPDTEMYDFRPGVRERLVGTLRRHEVGEVSDALLRAVVRQDLTVPDLEGRPAGVSTGPEPTTALALPTGPIVDITRWTLGQLRSPSAQGTSASAGPADDSWMVSLHNGGDGAPVAGGVLIDAWRVLTCSPELSDEWIVSFPWAATPEHRRIQQILRPPGGDTGAGMAVLVLDEAAPGAVAPAPIVGLPAEELVGERWWSRSGDVVVRGTITHALTHGRIGVRADGPEQAPPMPGSGVWSPASGGVVALMSKGQAPGPAANAVTLAQFDEWMPAARLSDRWLSHRREPPAETEYLMEAKVVLVGDAGVGKTTLARKILDPGHPVAADEGATHGVSVSSWRFPSLVPVAGGTVERQFRAHIWDFGGQETYHATHQLFLTGRSVYVLVLDGRREETDIGYWLETVSLLSGRSPLMIVQNRGQGHLPPLDVPTLRREYPNLAGTFNVDLSDNVGLAEFTARLRRELELLPHVGTVVPRNWQAVHRALDDDPRDFISAAEFFAICARHGLTREPESRRLGELLHDLGTCLYFPDDPMLADVLILNPAWALRAVHRVLDDGEVVANRGVMTPADLTRIWWEPAYTSMRAELLRLMVRFALCYQIPGTDSYLAPQLLPPARPAYSWDEPGTVALRYEYDVMPKGIVRRLIVALHDLIEGDAVWRGGVVLARGGGRAEAVEDHRRRRLHLRFTPRGVATLRALIDQELDRVHRSYPDLRFVRLLPCDCPVCSDALDPTMFSVEELEDFARTGDRIQCRLSRRLIDPADLLRRLDQPEPSDSALEVFVSANQGSEADAVVAAITARLAGRGAVRRGVLNGLRYRDLIEQFIRRPAANKHVVLVIDDAYLRSAHCMAELTLVASHPDMLSRVSAIVLADANVFSAIGRLGYVRWWEQKRADLEEAARSVNPMQGIRKELDLYESFRTTLAGIIDILADMNTLPPDAHRGRDFEAVLSQFGEPVGGGRALSASAQRDLDDAALRVQLAARENISLLRDFIYQETVQERLRTSGSLREFVDRKGPRGRDGLEGWQVYVERQLTNVADGRPTHEIHRVILEALGTPPVHDPKWYTGLVTRHLDPDRPVNSRPGGSGGLNELIPLVKQRWGFRRHQLKAYLTT